jgi:hypothetical protein
MWETICSNKWFIKYMLRNGGLSFMALISDEDYKELMKDLREHEDEMDGYAN